MRPPAWPLRPVDPPNPETPSGGLAPKRLGSTPDIPVSGDTSRLGPSSEPSEDGPRA